ncbi:hypothetical protein KFE25_003895 [Diacronema lutheri]|uniref:ferroxidase n=2 Tax=Diacronema lutheri TaxID=2081491 RepID=A0A8J5XL74_DIALT|nr:hypothetical protein KFE25_003895 [Diacronema lutheri]
MLLARLTSHAVRAPRGAGRARLLAAGSTGADGTSAGELEMHKYHAVANRTLESLQERMEAMIDEGDDDGSDVDFSGDVLNLTLSGHGTFVLNKQAPNKQIWLSSPVSGPQRYDLDVGCLDWLNTRDGAPLGAVLSRDIAQLTKREVRFDVRQAVEDAWRS